MPTAQGSETIAAISSPFGEGAVALIRISGADAVGVLGQIFRGGVKAEQMVPRKQYLGSVVVGDGSPIDEVLATVFRAPASYTGEDLAEIACHGGIHVTRRVLDAVLEVGARPAEPGEFTQRAFVAGKLDLTQAEAVMDLIRARSDLALTSAQAQLAGGLGRGMEAMRQELLGLLAQLEAHIDFPEEDIDPQTGESLIERLEEARTEVDRLLGTAERGRIAREGLATVLCGAPNVGKSSLLNALSGRDRAIVSEIAGTTRDTVEELLHVGGIALRLIDTAGLRSSEDQVEQQGIARTHRALEEADLVIEVVDASRAPEHQERVDGSGPSASHLVVLNKTDLGVDPGWDGLGGGEVRISCTEGDGIEGLVTRIRETIEGGGEGFGRDPVAINARHQDCLRRARVGLDAAIGGLRENAFPELVAIEVRSALEAIGEVVGKADTEDLLGEIFANFCIGK